MADLLPFRAPEPPPESDPPLAGHAARLAALLPCPAWPGSAARIATLTLRARFGLPLSVRGDCTVLGLPPDVGYLPGCGAGSTYAGAIVRELPGGGLEVLEARAAGGGRYRAGQRLRPAA